MNQSEIDRILKGTTAEILEGTETEFSPKKAYEEQERRRMATKCTCDIKLLWDLGCRCGGAAMELAQEQLSREAEKYRRVVRDYVPNPLEPGNDPSFRWVSIQKMAGGFRAGDRIRSFRSGKQWEVVSIRAGRDEIILYSMQTNKRRTYSLTQVFGWRYSIHLPEDRILDRYRKVN